MRLVLVGVVIAAFFLGFDMFRPPVLPLDADPQLFSAERAFVTVEAIAEAPHPTGHPEGERVRGWLVEALQQLGLEVSIQETIVFGGGSRGHHGSEIRAAGVVEGVRVRNIVARLPGKSMGEPPDSTARERDAILLAAHTDTRPAAPGAADDSSGVAIILEVMRVLREGEPLERDVIALLTDAEELGLFGAKAFVDEHPLAKEIAVVINLEARGNRGASRMFETAEGNAEWIEALDRATGSIAADSLSASIYRAMPRDTDLTVFRKAGMAGYNFAFIRGIEHYHTPLDRPEFLDLGSVQEQGEAVLALAKTLAVGELPRSVERDAVYFPFAGELWRLESRTSRILSIVAAVLAVCAVIRAMVLRVVRFGGLLRALIGGSLLIAAVNFFALVVSRALSHWLDDGVLHPSRFEAAAGPLILAFLVVGGTTIVSGWVALRDSGLRRAELIGAGLLGWGVVLFALEWFLPNAAYLGSLPLLGGAVVLLGQGEAGSRGGWGVLLSLCGVLPVIALWPRTLDGVGVAFGAAAAPAVVGMFGMMLPLAAPVLAEAIPSRVRRRHAWGRWIAILWFVVAVVAAERGDGVPRAGSVHYAYDATNEVAMWVSFDEEPGEFARQFLGEKPPREPSGLESLAAEPPKVWVRSAASRALSGPKFVVSDLGQGEVEGAEGESESKSESEWVGRVIEVQLPEGTARFDLESESFLHGVEILDGGEWKRVAERLVRLRLTAPGESVQLRVRVPMGRAVELRGTAMRYGLPEMGTWTPEPRTPDQMESIGDRTYVTTTHLL